MLRRRQGKKRNESTQKRGTDEKAENSDKGSKGEQKPAKYYGEQKRKRKAKDKREKSVFTGSESQTSSAGRCRSSECHKKRHPIDSLGKNEVNVNSSNGSQQKLRKKSGRKDRIHDTVSVCNASGEESSKKIKFSLVQRKQKDKSPSSKTLKLTSTAEKMRSSGRCDNSTTSSAEIEIPGFYYDPQKKKYFRIQPSQFSKVEHTVTKETISKRAKEEKRCHDMTALSSCSQKKDKYCKRKNNFPFILNQSRCGDFTQEFFYKTFLHSRLSHMDIQPSSLPIVVQSWPSITFSKLDHSIQMEKNRNSDKIVGLYSVKNNLSQKIQLMDIKETQRTEEKQSRLAIEMKGVDSPQQTLSSLLLANKVTSMCWADQNLYPNDLCILYSVMSYVHSECPNYVALHSLYSRGGVMRVNPVFPIGNRFIWSCGWDKSSNRLSVGSEKCALVLDTISRSMWEFNTDNSDVFSQVFSGKNGRCLYNGTRNGKILIHDLRSRSTYPVSRAAMSSSVCCLRMLQSDAHLLASDVRGKVCLWDLRMIRQSVVDYKGSYNVYSRIPVHVEENADVVYGADLHGYTRLWSLRDGTLLRTIPPPVPTDIETIPTVLYSDSWGNKSGNSGLLIGIHDKVYLYPS